MAFRVEIGGVLRNIVSGRLEIFARVIGEAIRPCMEELGIPVPEQPIPYQPNVTTFSGEPIVRVLLDERYRVPSRALLLAAWQEIGARQLQQDCVSRHFQEWLSRLAAYSADGLTSGKAEDHANAAAELVASVAVKIVRHHPEELFGEEEADRWLRRADVRFLDAARLVNLVRPALRARMSLQNKEETIAEVLKEGLSRRDGDAEIAEKLIAKLGPNAPSIRVQVSPPLDADATQDIQRMIALTADQVLFGRLGIRVPFKLIQVAKNTAEADHAAPFQVFANRIMRWLSDRVLIHHFGIRTTPDLNKPEKNSAEADVTATFQIFLNDQSQGAFAGLPDDHVLVNIPPEELPDKVQQWRGWIMPDGSEASVVPAKFAPDLDEAQLNFQNSPEYMTKRVVEEVRRCAWFLMTADAAEMELARVAQHCPDLALAAARQLSPSQLAAILSQLLREGVSIRNLVTILERLVGFDRVVVDEFECEVYDDRLPVHPKLANLASPLLDHHERVRQVRRGLQRAIRSAQSRGGMKIRALPLDPSIEKELLDHVAALHGHPEAAGLSAAKLFRITAAIGKAVDRFSLGARPPAVLATGSIRWFLYDLMADEFPNLAVIGNDELTAQHVQELGRVTLSG